MGTLSTLSTLSTPHLASASLSSSRAAAEKLSRFCLNIQYPAVWSRAGAGPGYVGEIGADEYLTKGTVVCLYAKMSAHNCSLAPVLPFVKTC